MLLHHTAASSDPPILQGPDTDIIPYSKWFPPTAFLLCLTWNLPSRINFIIYNYVGLKLFQAPSYSPETDLSVSEILKINMSQSKHNLGFLWYSLLLLMDPLSNQLPRSDILKLSFICLLYTHIPSNSKLQGLFILPTKHFSAQISFSIPTILILHS